MDREQSSSTYDREVDAGPREVPVFREPVDPCRRFVANPLLAVAVCVLAIVLLRYSVERRILLLFLVGSALLPGAVFFSQFHCLDCGATGWLLAARRHICPPLVVRWRQGPRSRWRFPSLKAQMIIWLYLLVSMAGLLLILFASGK